MKFLIRRNGKKVKAHIWSDDDTVCRMYSTGGLRKDRYRVLDEPGNHKICHMCQHVYDKKSRHLTGDEENKVIAALLISSDLEETLAPPWE